MLYGLFVNGDYIIIIIKIMIINLKLLYDYFGRIGKWEEREGVVRVTEWKRIYIF